MKESNYPMINKTTYKSKKSQLLWISFFLVCFISTGSAESHNIYKQSAPIPLELAYTRVYASLEQNNFWVIEEINIGQSLSRFEEKWGDEYNQNKLTAIRVMIVCNGWYANQVSNKDPDMLALCPIRITLYEKDNKTSVVFARPSVIANGSPAESVVLEIENIIIKSIQDAMK